jgi:hypothetical protein
MYGYATYFEIGSDGRFRVFIFDEEKKSWETTDLTASYCK